MWRFIKRFLSLKNVDLIESHSNFICHKNVYLDIQGEVIVNKGTLTLGYPLPKTVKYASQSESFLYVEKGGKVICDGSVLIAPGFTIRVKAGGILYFKGDNLIGHNVIILCSNSIDLGLDTSLSWDCTLIDNDGHILYNSDDRPLKFARKKLILGNSVGIQMNVKIPSGVTVGDQAIVSAGTILRTDVPSKHLVYQKTELVLKKGIHHKGFTGSSSKEAGL